MIKEIIQNAFVLKSQGHYKHAIEAFYKALEIDNSSSELLLEIADLYYLMNDEERAVNYIEQSLDKNPAHIASLELLKKIFIAKKAWKEAEQTARNIFAISKNEYDLAKILNLLNIQDKFSEVVSNNIDTDNNEVLYELAFANFKLNRLEQAESIINRVLDTKAEQKYLLLKGKILLKSSRERESLEVLEQLKVDDTDADFLNFAGTVKQYNGEYKDAINYFLAASKISAKKDEYYYNCASTYFKMGEIQLAKKYYNLAISIAPDNPNYHFALANLYYSEKHYKRALEELKYDFFEAKLLKSIILYDTGYLAIAKKEFDKLIQERSDDPIVNRYMARIEEELKI